MTLCQDYWITTIIMPLSLFEEYRPPIISCLGLTFSNNAAQCKRASSGPGQWKPKFGHVGQRSQPTASRQNTGGKQMLVEGHRSTFPEH